ncbi:MAG: carbohydrate-binding family 9-like protein [Myxococcales bacterium]|nr:carbohydrate-binding family 9-like protein [Myxococcales bacterium]
MSFARLSISAPLALLLAWGCQEYAEPALTPAQQKKVEAHLLAAPPTPQHAIGAVIEDQVKLLGYDIDKTEVAPGDTLTVTYYLEVLAESPADNMIFVHFQGRRNDPKAWMNLDHHPIEGLQPLRGLKKGQYVKDVQVIKVREDFPGGEAKIYWGLFRGNHRLKIQNDDAPHDNEGRVIVATLTVKGAASEAPDRKPNLPLAVAARLNADEVMNVDGKLDEPVWQRARPTAAFTTPDGRNGTAPKTKARFAWDDNTLYVAVESEDDDVWSTFTERDSNTWEQEVIELFIDADGDKKDYLELQVTPANVIFDAKFVSHRSDLAAAKAWNMEGFKTAVVVDGTLNQREDQDKGYVVEMAIPAAQVPGATVPLAHSAEWRINVFRWDFPKGGRQQAAAFSPPVVPDFHALDRFGRLRFVDSSKLKELPIQKAAPFIKPKTLHLDARQLPKLQLPPAGNRQSVPLSPPAAQGGGASEGVQK